MAYPNLEDTLCDYHHHTMLSASRTYRAMRRAKLLAALVHGLLFILLSLLPFAVLVWSQISGHGKLQSVALAFIALIPAVMHGVHLSRREDDPFQVLR